MLLTRRKEMILFFIIIIIRARRVIGLVRCGCTAALCVCVCVPGRSVASFCVLFVVFCAAFLHTLILARLDALFLVFLVNLNVAVRRVPRQKVCKHSKSANRLPFCLRLVLWVHWLNHDFPRDLCARVCFRWHIWRRERVNATERTAKWVEIVVFISQ